MMRRLPLDGVTGPLAPYASGFAQVLESRGYAATSSAAQLRLMAHVSRWLAGQGLDAGGLDPQRMADFIEARRRAGYWAFRTVRALDPLMGFLRGLGVAPEPLIAEPVGTQGRLLAEYRAYLLQERGLAGALVRRWAVLAEAVLAEYPDVAAGAGFGPGEVTTMCARRLPLVPRSTAANWAAGLRSFLRFLHLRGLIDTPLVGAVPPVAGRRDTALPLGISPKDVQRLVATCDRRTVAGRRDYAVMLLLSRLGLRAGEVARLLLDDIDWRAGELLVHGKGGREDRLPLPHDVGAALAGYLQRGRASCAQDRTVFVRTIAPAAALTPTGITWVVHRACDRAGIPRVGPHRLRHTCATDMLRAGASLTEVGQVLRHAGVATTAIYAKVDFVHLLELARPWPGAEA